MAPEELHLGGEDLDKALRQCGFGTPIERTDALKQILAYDLLVPVEKLQGDVDPGSTIPVPLVTNSKGTIGFPLFTRPERLKEYAQVAGWTATDQDPTYLGMNAQGAMEVATSTDATVTVIDPGGPIPVVVTRAEVEKLLQKSEPPKITTARQPVVPAPTAPPLPVAETQQTAAKYAAAPTDLPSRIPSVLRVLMEQYHQVKTAVLFTDVSASKVCLGLVMRSDDIKAEPILKSAREALARLAPGKPFDVVHLIPGMIDEVLTAAKPFYMR